MMRGKRVAIYARVSTTDKGQDPDLQLRTLRDYCRDRQSTITGEYVDYTTGVGDRRPELKQLMDAAKKRQIDCIIVWKLDRFGRSLKHLVTALDDLNALGVGFISYTENLDFQTPTGRLMFHIVGAMAEFEHELIRERVRTGLANAKAKGKRLGRRAVSASDRRRIIEAHDDNPELSIRKLAAQVKLNYGTVNKTLSLLKDGKCDRDGFLYEANLC